MTAKKKSNALTEKQIDEAVISQADDNDAWGEPVHVGAYDRQLSLRMPVDLLRRASLQARKEGFSHVEDWVMHLLTVAVKHEHGLSLVEESPVSYGEKEDSSSDVVEELRTLQQALISNKKP